MFQRYNVTSATDQVEVLRKMAVYLADLPKQHDQTVIEMPQAVGRHRTRTKRGQSCLK
jgi:hypothetical protein